MINVLCGGARSGHVARRDRAGRLADRPSTRGAGDAGGAPRSRGRDALTATRARAASARRAQTYAVESQSLTCRFSTLAPCVVGGGLGGSLALGSAHQLGSAASRRPHGWGTERAAGRAWAPRRIGRGWSSGRAVVSSLCTLARGLEPVAVVIIVADAGCARSTRLVYSSHDCVLVLE